MTIKTAIRFKTFERVAAMLCAASLSASSYASMMDALACFSTKGIDRYADGSAVVDGECYALVWSPKGSSFSGFKADGSLESPDDRVVLAGGLAIDGHCQESCFQIPAAEYAALQGGEWAVCLVDTRTAQGVPAGVGDNGVPLRVNRWGIVDKGGAKLQIGTMSDSAATVASAFRSMTMTSSAKPSTVGSCAEALSSVPEDAPSPQITAIEVANGVVRLTVEGTVPYLKYGISSGETPDALSADSAGGVADGTGGAAIEFEADATTGARFFRVTRAE